MYSQCVICDERFFIAQFAQLLIFFYEVNMPLAQNSKVTGL